MINKANRKILNETYRNASKAITAIYATIDKVEDEELALELTRQVGKYNSIIDRAEEELQLIGEKPSGAYWSKKILKADINRKTIGSKNASRIADVMIQNNTKSMINTTRSIHDNLAAKREYTELAGELVDFEQKNIERMKLYL